MVADTAPPVIVISSLPKPLTVPATPSAYKAVNWEYEPAILVIPEALTATLVLPSKLVRSAAWVGLVSTSALTVNDNRSLLLVCVKAATKLEAASVVTVAVTAPEVALAIASTSLAATETSVNSTVCVPKPV